jgi:CheY-like chemotaxis protein
MKQIILADDDPVTRNLCKAIINDSFPNYEIETLPSGISLVERLERDLSGVRLVLADNSMPPGPTGSEIIKRYAGDARFKDIPFILTTAGEEEIGIKAVKNGAFAYFLKPFNMLHVIPTLQTALVKYHK